MANAYNFDDGQLQLPAAKVAQFTKALATAEVADPLQQLCDEAAADVARLTAGYIIDNVSISNFIRALAIFKAYTNSGTPCPADTETNYKNVWNELQSIARGDRPNLPKQSNPQLLSRAGAAGSNRRIHGRMGGWCGVGGGE